MGRPEIQARTGIGAAVNRPKRIGVRDGNFTQDTRCGNIFDESIQDCSDRLDPARINIGSVTEAIPDPVVITIRPPKYLPSNFQGTITRQGIHLYSTEGWSIADYEAAINHPSLHGKRGSPDIIQVNFGKEKAKQGRSA